MSVLCALDMTTMQATSYGILPNSTNNLQLYRDRDFVGPAELMYMDVTNGPSAPRRVAESWLKYDQFTAGVMIPGTPHSSAWAIRYRTTSSTRSTSRPGKRLTRIRVVGRL